MQEKISIVMTSYNYANYIGEAIESVIAQTYTDWELIIVDDGSVDNSLEIINTYLQKDTRIKLFRHKNGINRGLAESLKLGIEKSESNWIAFLESDDRFLPNAIQDKVEAIKKHANIDFVFSDLVMFGVERRVKSLKQFYFDTINKFIALDESKFIPTLPAILPKINIIPTFSVVMVKKELIQKCNFNSICKPSLDYFLWAQLSGYKVYYLHKLSTEWRIHENSYITTDKSSWLKKYVFYISIFYQTVKNKNVFLKILLALNFARQRLIYFKIDKHSIKLNLLNGLFIYEKH